MSTSDGKSEMRRRRRQQHSGGENTPTLKKYVIAPYDPIYRVWQTFLVVLVVYSSCELAFRKMSTTSTNALLPINSVVDAFFLIDLVVEAFFVLDIVLTFFVAYLDKDTHLFVDDHNKIAMRYIRHLWFPMDVASTLPFFTGKMHVFGLLKLWRLRRLVEFFSRFTLFGYFWKRICKLAMKKVDHEGAGLRYIQLFNKAASQEEAINHLENAKMHFEEGLDERAKVGDSAKLVRKGIWWKSASKKLTDEEVFEFWSRVEIQIDVVRSFEDAEGPQWKHSLFDNPKDSQTFRRRCTIAETLVEKNFDLAFQVIHEFNLPAIDIYTSVALSLAERKKDAQLIEFCGNINGTIDDEDLDQQTFNPFCRYLEQPLMYMPIDCLRCMDSFKNIFSAS